MTILLFIDYGFENYRGRFLEELCLRGFEISCITQKETRIVNPAIRFEQIGSIGYESSLRGFQEVIRIPFLLYSIKKINPSVIIVGNMGINSLASIIYSKVFQVPVIVWARLTVWTEKNRSPLISVYRRCILFMSRSIIVNSESGSRYISTLTKTHTNIIPQVSSIERKIYKSPVTYQSSQGNRIFCYVGRLVKGKGLENVLKILAINDFRGTIRIVGEGPMLDELLKIELSDGMNVEFLGWCDSTQVELIISQSDALIFSSECDEWGLAVVEAVNLGCPVLGSIRAGAVEELLVDREHGYLYDPFDAETIGRAFAKFSELNDEEITLMKSNCLKLSAERKLSAENMARLFEESILRAID